MPINHYLVGTEITGMTAPVETDIEIIQGATFNMQVAWSDTSQDPAVPVPLTGYRAHMQIRSKAATTGQLLVDLSSSDEPATLTIEPNSATGVIAVRIPATDTVLLKKTCYYDLFVINESDDTDATRLLFGTVTISPSVTVDG